MVAELTHGRVAPVQRFTRSLPCPVCGGWQGRGCWGFLSDDGRYAFCTADAFAGALSLHPTAQAYKHLLEGACWCGVEHGGAIATSDLYERIPEATAPKRSHHEKTPTAIYDRYDNPNVRKLRYGTGKGKYFVWQHADGQGDWINGLEGQAPGLYNGAALASADPFTPVYVTEGEGDADKVIAAGGVAISPPGGANGWADEYSERLRGFLVVVCGDRDESGKGQAHAQHVAESAAAQGALARVVFFHDAHDVGDWLRAGHTLDELRALAAHAPIISARMVESRNTCEVEPHVQVAVAPPSDGACRHCEHWRVRALDAEARLHHVTKEQTMAAVVIRNPALSDPVKLTYMATRTVLANKPARDERGMTQVWRSEIAELAGKSEDTVTRHLTILEKAGALKREAPKVLRDDGSVDHYELWLGETEVFDQPDKIIPLGGPRKHGGARTKRTVSVPTSCLECGSTNVTIRAELVCLEPECGAVEPLNLNRMDTSETADSCEVEPHVQVAGPNTFPSLIGDRPQLERAADADERHELLNLAERLGWPRIPLDLQRIIGHYAGDAQAWRDFADTASPEDLDTIRYRLMAKHAALSGGD